MGRTLYRLFLLTLCFALMLAAQTGNATINGRVTDATGAAVPDTVISVKNTATNVARTTHSNHEGLYSVPNLIPGTYALTAQFHGFKNLERENIVLRVGDRATLDLQLEIGSSAERVTVTGEVPLLRIDDVQSGLVVDNRRIEELPQYNRNVLALTQLSPNVGGTDEQVGYNSNFRINGGRTAQAEYVIDGVPVTTAFMHEVPPSVPSMEAVAEFKVLTNGLSAEYGRLSGGAVVLVTRSGTNAYHGSGYEFFRNDKLNANDWNSNRFGRSKGVFHDNVFGGTLGGPVRLPKIYNGRDKTFFFVNYEGVRNSKGTNAAFASVPTPLEREGDFSQSLIDQGVPVQIFDPLTARVEVGRVARSPFPGNRIPKDRFNPISKIYLEYYPLPNQPPRPNSSHDQNYVGASSGFADNNRWTGRLDHNWTSNHATHFSLTRYESHSGNNRWFSKLQPAGSADVAAHTISLEHTWTLTPSTILNLHGGLVRAVTVSGSTVVADSSNWPLQREVYNLLGTTRDRVEEIRLGWVNSLGGGVLSDKRDTNYSWALSLQKLWGKHTLKLGYDHRRYYTNNVGNGGMFAVSAGREVTSRYFDDLTTGADFATWLLGQIVWGTGSQNAGAASLQAYHGAYFQDDIKLTNKLTVNAGIRWDFEPPRTERYNRIINWDRNYRWSWKPNPTWSWDQVLQQAGATMPAPGWLTKGIFGRLALAGTLEYPGRTMQESYPSHFGPRFGLAYQFLPRTVLRAGYGINWLTVGASHLLGYAPSNVGYGDFARLAERGTPDGGLTFPLTFDTPMPGGAGYIAFTRDVDTLNRRVMGNWLLVGALDFYPGYEHTFQVGIQREVGSGANAWVLEINYSANLGRNLPMYSGRGEHILPDAWRILGPLGHKLLTPASNPFFGQITPNTTMGGQSLPFGRMFQLNPLWQQISTMGEPLGTANYHSGYVQAEHRFGRGFSFLANYTVSKLLQDVGSLGGGEVEGYPQAGMGFGDIYGLSPTDRTHRFLFNYSWDLPAGRGKRLLGNPQSAAQKVVDKFVGGWVVAGTTTFRSGTPIKIVGPTGRWFTVGHASNGATERPRLVIPRVPYDPGVSGHSSLEGSAGFQPYINPASFRLTDGFELGDVGSVLPDMRGPGFSQWDLSLLKNISLGRETRSLQLRFEAQNFFNHMNAGQPNGDIRSRTFGMITGAGGTSRLVMIASKLSF